MFESGLFKVRSRRSQITMVLALVAVIAFSAIYAVILMADLTGAKDSLYAGRDSLERAYREIEETDFNAAGKSFEDASSDFTTAKGALNQPSVKMLAILPIANKNVYAVRGLTTAGLEVALAGRSFAHASMKFPQNQGRLDFDFKDGTIDLKPFIAAKPHIDEANYHVLLAVAQFEKVPDGRLVSQVRKAKEEFAKELPKLKELTTSTKQVFDIMPEALGGNGKRRYFLAIQNNAELRATGGLIGNYGILTVENGKIALESFDEIHKLQRPNQEAVAVPSDYMARYGRFDAASLWLNSNMSPDFPTVGRVIIELYKSATGVTLDGVISVDPVGLKYLLAAIGPVKIPQATIDINADNVVDWTLVKAYSEYQDRDERKEFLADVAKAVWERIAGGDIGDTSEFISQLKQALSEKHMILYSVNRKEQAICENLGYAGELVQTDNDYLNVVLQNHGANKLDTYMHEKIAYYVEVKPDGSALAKVSITLTNRTPPSGLPDYVTGPEALSTKGGHTNTWLSVYVPKGAQLISENITKKASDIDIGSEKGKAVFAQYVKLAPGTSSMVEYAYFLPYVLVFDSSQIDYKLVWQSQAVLNKPEIKLTIVVPEGFAFKKIPDGFERKGNEVTYEGSLVKDESFVCSLLDNR